MIKGFVSEDGMPLITLAVAGRKWNALVDSGFNEDLELPDALRDELELTPFGPIESNLAAGKTVTEQAYLVTFPFEGEDVLTLATFVSSDRIVIGTRLLRHHKLSIDFPNGTLLIERTAAT